jgi:hypothetical protein
VGQKDNVRAFGKKVGHEPEGEFGRITQGRAPALDPGRIRTVGQNDLETEFSKKS